MFKFNNEVDAKLAIYEACMNGEITEAQKDSLMMSLNKKLGKVLLEKIKSGMKFKYAGDTYIAKGSVTYQTVSGVKIPTLKVQKEDGTVTNLQFDPEEDKAVRLVKESVDTTDESDAFIESVNADIEFYTEAADAAGATSKVMGVIKSATAAVKGLVAKAKKHSADKKTLDELTFAINGLEGCAGRLQMSYNIWKKDADAGKESAKGWWKQLIKTKTETTKEIEAARAICGKLGDIAKDEAKRLAEIEEEYNKMVVDIGNKIQAAEANQKKTVTESTSDKGEIYLKHVNVLRKYVSKVINILNETITVSKKAISKTDFDNHSPNIIRDKKFAENSISKLIKYGDEKKDFLKSIMSMDSSTDITALKKAPGEFGRIITNIESYAIDVCKMTSDDALEKHIEKIRELSDEVWSALQNK